MEKGWGNTTPSEPTGKVCRPAPENPEHPGGNGPFTMDCYGDADMTGWKDVDDSPDAPNVGGNGSWQQV